MAGAHNNVLPLTARLERWRVRCRLALAGFYGLAGVLHLAVPEPFLGITPSWVPEPEAVIALTGVSEIAGAIGLLVPAVRSYAAVGLALYAVGVFPANIDWCGRRGGGRPLRKSRRNPLGESLRREAAPPLPPQAST